MTAYPHNLGRKRKKKCDENRTRCLNCTRQSLSCVWQFSVDQQPLQSESEHQVHPLSDSSTKHITIPADLTVQHHMERADAGRLYLSSLRHIHWTPSPAITPHSGPLFDFLRTTFLPQLIRPATDGTVTNGLNRETMQLALGHPFCMHALLACCGAEMPTKEKRFRQLARFHYTHAVAGLRRTLTDSHLECRWVVTMLTIMMLCIYEVYRLRTLRCLS